MELHKRPKSFTKAACPSYQPDSLYIVGSGICQLNFPSMLSLCGDLRELLVEVEPCFLDSDDEWDDTDDTFSKSRRRQTSLSARDYDPETDDYEMITTCPECPEVVELEERQLIMKQIMSLQNRIAQGGPQLVHFLSLLLKLSTASKKGWETSACPGGSQAILDHYLKASLPVAGLVRDCHHVALPSCSDTTNYVKSSSHIL